MKVNLSFACACAIAVGGAVALGGCGQNSANSDGHITIGLADFKITPSATETSAHQVIFSVANHAQQKHELLIIRTDRVPNSLPRSPTEPDRIDEESTDGMNKLDEETEVEPGANGLIDVKLTPGHYVLICNITKHYDSGMHTAFVVD